MNQDPANIKVAVGMSGGVDSSIAASILKRQGYQVFGLTMKIWDGSLPIPDEGRSGCYGPGEERDIAAARSVCRQLGIQHHIIDLAAEYKEEVLAYFRSEYLAGRTPNPCVRCNHKMKFGFLIDRARSQGLEFDHFATGHYARVQFDAASGRYLLKCAADRRKDQSYFLSHLRQEQLKQLFFPLGEMDKSQVKDLAREMGWHEIADKAESQDFIEAKDYGVLFQSGECRPGPILGCDGEQLGEHRGIIHYTIGQRKGLGSGAAEPLYVTGIDAGTNTIRVGNREALLSRTLKAVNVNWISERPPAGCAISAQAKIRQQHKAAEALLTAADDSTSALLVEFREPQASITPGQTVVFYSNETVLGGGIIAAGE